jgi:hypothetical protein
MCICLVVSLSDSRDHRHLLRFVVATTCSCRQMLYGATHHTAAHELLMGLKHAFIATSSLQQ